jgi:hypothetical protein
MDIFRSLCLQQAGFGIDPPATDIREGQHE